MDRITNTDQEMFANTVSSDTVSSNFVWQCVSWIRVKQCVTWIRVKHILGK